MFPTPPPRTREQKWEGWVAKQKRAVEKLSSGPLWQRFAERLQDYVQSHQGQQRLRIGPQKLVDLWQNKDRRLACGVGALAGATTFKLTQSLWLALTRRVPVIPANRVLAWVAGLSGLVVASACSTGVFLHSSSYYAFTVTADADFPFIPYTLPWTHRYASFERKHDSWWTRTFERPSTASTQLMLLYSVSTSISTYILFRGRMRYFTPSSIHTPGAFAQANLAIRASGAKYATYAQRRVLQQIGRDHGCHHCGDRTARKYIGDHIPPNKYAQGMFFRATQWFYPQCEDCSSLQSVAVRTDQRQHVTPNTLRFSSLWLPLGPLFFLYNATVQQDISEIFTQVFLS
jgi:hypothetical protein